MSGIGDLPTDPPEFKESCPHCGKDITARCEELIEIAENVARANLESIKAQIAKALEDESFILNEGNISAGTKKWIEGKCRAYKFVLEEIIEKHTQGG